MQVEHQPVTEPPKAGDRLEVTSTRGENDDVYKVTAP